MKKIISTMTMLVMIVIFTGIMPLHTVSAVSTLPTTSAEPSPGCTFLGIEGKYITQIQDAIDRINEIRLEACREGVISPATKKPLTPDDYVPIQWSADLEYIARIRAAEASVTIGHTRTNGKSIWFSGPNGISSNAEDIAWNWSETMTYGIEQWYDEKDDWVDNKGGVTGHYTSMIDPRYHFVGLATFCSGVTNFYNTTVGEFSMSKTVPDTSRGSSTGTIIQTLDVKNEYITYEIVCPDNIKDADAISVAASVTFQDSRSTKGLVLPEDTAKNIQWSSSDSNIIYVSNGQIKIKTCGSVIISAKLPDGKTISKPVSVQHDYEETTKQATCKDAGAIIKKCKICGNTVTETIPKTNQHTYETTTKEATCKDEGAIIKKCKVCGNTVTETIPKTNQHKFGSWVTTKAPTATEDGTETRTCTVCGTVETRPLKHMSSETTAPSTTSADKTPETSAEPKPDTTSSAETSGAPSTEAPETSRDETSQQVPATDGASDQTANERPSDSSDDQNTPPSDNNNNNDTQSGLPSDDTDASTEASVGSGSNLSRKWVPIAAAGGVLLLAVIAVVVVVICLHNKKKKV